MVATSSRNFRAGVAQDLLVLTESVVFGCATEVSYFDFAMRAALAERMLRWISLVPPAIVMPYEFM